MNYDVIVAGGGPVGLMLACELRLAGVSVVVLERESQPNPAIKAGPIGARSINAPTADAFHRRGLLKAVKETATFWYEPEPDPSVVRNRVKEAVSGHGPQLFVGHFGGIMIRADRIDFTDHDLSQHTLGGGVVNQYAIESILREQAARLGVELRPGIELTGFETGETGVTVDAGGQRIQAGWLVGCDGGRSTVRKLAGFDFPGTDPECTGRHAIVDIANPEVLTSEGWMNTASGSYVCGPVPFVQGPAPTRLYTVEYGSPPANRNAPVTAEEMEASLFRVSGIQVSITRVHTAIRHTDTTRQATTYRKGRVLLAGDSAHIHWPAGGQGLNLGIGDAMNLGWKLAATVHGWAPGDLLDTYTAERHPLGAWVQDWSNAQTALSRPDPRTQALRTVVADLLDTGPGATYVLKQISGVWQHYDLPGDHPMIGRRAPDLKLNDGTTLAERGQDGRAILLDLTDHAGLQKLAGRWGPRVNTITASCAAFPVLSGLLVRPDGYVAWADDEALDLRMAERALRTWLGDPVS